MHPSLKLVSERFAELRERVAGLFERDDNFRDLCEDYEACARTVARLQSGGPCSGAMRDEYAALLLRLERELLRHLEEDPGRDGS